MGLVVCAPDLAPAADVGLYARRMERSAPMAVRGTTLAPFAYILFCRKNPGDCQAGGPAVAEAEAEVLATVRRINRSVNARIKGRVDDERDLWEVGTASGDCEDFALTKRRQLIAAGLPASSLRMAVATTREGDGHAVLVFHTTAGNFVLDNRTDAILPWNRTGLSWIKMASADNPKVWNAL
ncbi:hypothetical protein ASG48_07220 [Aurantimonas sp. Leaf443]|nr:hypothetical protein ASG48_07220 [Aurantimonas sp. Leaf443]